MSTSNPVGAVSPWSIEPMSVEPMTVEPLTVEPLTTASIDFGAGPDADETPFDARLHLAPSGTEHAITIVANEVVMEVTPGGAQALGAQAPSAPNIELHESMTRARPEGSGASISQPLTLGPIKRSGRLAAADLASAEAQSLNQTRRRRH
jgi:hypothetical protein